MSALSQYHDLILCIVSALEARDSYTSFHSSRVAEMVEVLCKFLGISSEQEELFHIAAHLHDVGKIGIRDNVLLKAGRLNDEEWNPDVVKVAMDNWEELIAAGTTNCVMKPST